MGWATPSSSGLSAMAILIPATTPISTPGASLRPACRSARSSSSIPHSAALNSTPRWQPTRRATSWSSGRRQFPGGLLRSIFGQRFSKTGKKVGPEFRVNEDRVEKDFAPSVAMDHDGNFVVAWESFSLARPDCVQVRARLYRRDGKPAGPEFPAAPGDAACGEAPKVAFGPNGVFAIAWQVELGFSPTRGPTSTSTPHASRRRRPCLRRRVHESGAGSPG